ncbi:MAG TPA: HD domain-containing protein [Candidatus Saccharimonadales bacterium]|nr:HD domain-containing protein [Candidatus Saccharimonadales bacterium]
MDRDIEFLYEMGTLRYIPRQWQRFANADFANLAEHHFRVMWIALIIAKHERADVNKVLKMALVHDICESRTGDADYLSRQYIERNEELGLKDMLAKTILEKGEFMDLWKELEELKTIEAKVVKDADNLDVDLELDEQEVRGFKLKYAWKTQRAWASKNRLHTKSGNRLLEKLRKSDPNAWHLNARNRINAGDWKGDFKK